MTATPSMSSTPTTSSTPIRATWRAHPVEIIDYLQKDTPAVREHFVRIRFLNGRMNGKSCIVRRGTAVPAAPTAPTAPIPAPPAHATLDVQDAT